MFVTKVTGDKTGTLRALPSTRIYVETHSIRSEAPVNFHIDTGGQILLPVRTTLRGTGSPALTADGEIHGIEWLKIFNNVNAILSEKGASACVTCNAASKTPYVGHYWFKKLQISLGGILNIQSSTQNVSARAVNLHLFEAALEYTGSVKADAVEIFTDYFSIEFDATADGSGLGWNAGQGPGSRTSCSSVAGAGHGGIGGSGYWSGCGSCSSNGGMLVFALPCAHTLIIITYGEVAFAWYLLKSSFASLTIFFGGPCQGGSGANCTLAVTIIMIRGIYRRHL